MSGGGVTRSEIHLFVYGTLMDGGSAAHLLKGCERVGAAFVTGTLYDTEDGYPALLLAGPGSVHGEMWRCPVDRLAALDSHEGVASGLFRRVGVEIGGRGCWTYVAGPALGPKLVAGQRVRGGRWRPPARRVSEV